MDYAKKLKIDAGQLLESKHDSILRNILQNPNNKMLDSLLKTLTELENGNETIRTLIHKYPSLSKTEEKLALALSYIKAENKESFAARCADILKNDKLTMLDKLFVEYNIIIEDDSVKNAIISSAYKFSVLRNKVGDSLFSKEGKFDEKWLKDGELTKWLSLVKKYLMEYVQPEENNSNSLNGTTKRENWNTLRKDLKAKVLSFLINPKKEYPDSIKEILTVLKKPLHKVLEEQENETGIYNKPLASLRKAAVEKGNVTGTSKQPGVSKEIAMPEVHEEQSGIYNAQLASLRKAMYEKAATVEGNKQDREPPASPPAPGT